MHVLWLMRRVVRMPSGAVSSSAAGGGDALALGGGGQAETRFPSCAATDLLDAFCR